jgi:hypothetical protein
MAHEIYGNVTATIKATTTMATISIISPSLELGWLTFIKNNGGRVVIVIIVC